MRGHPSLGLLIETHHYQMLVILENPNLSSLKQNHLSFLTHLQACESTGPVLLHASFILLGPENYPLRVLLMTPTEVKMASGTAMSFLKT